MVAYYYIIGIPSEGCFFKQDTLIPMAETKQFQAKRVVSIIQILNILRGRRNTDNTLDFIRR
jgi:hypothetical protein